MYVIKVGNRYLSTRRTNQRFVDTYTLVTRLTARVERFFDRHDADRVAIKVAEMFPSCGDIVIREIR